MHTDTARDVTVSAGGVLDRTVHACGEGCVVVIVFMLGLCFVF